MTRIVFNITLVGMICLSLAAAAAPCDMLWGLWNPSQPWNGDQMASTAAIDTKLGRSSDIVHFYANWGDGSGDMVNWWNVPQYLSIAQNFTSLAQTQHIPMLTWQPWGNKFTVSPAEYPLTSIANGAYDSYINSWATGLKALNKPIFLRPLHEFDGTWYPWGNVNGNTPAQYIAAWIHIRNLFTAAGATNVIFVWCPNNSNSAGVDQTQYYPGDQYVDWVGIDLYSDNGASFKQTITTYCNPQNLYGRLTAMTSKPIMIAEFGLATGQGITQAAWLRQAISDIQTSMTQIKALVYFNQYSYSLDTTASDFGTIASTLGGGCAPSRAINANIGQPTPTSSTTRSTTSSSTSRSTTSSSTTSPTTSSTTSSSTTSSSTTSAPKASTSASPVVGPAPAPSANPCVSMFANLQCRTLSEDPTQMDASSVSNARGWLCGTYPQYCTDINSGGQYSGCNSVEQLSNAMNKYYGDFGPQQSACSFGGIGQVVTKAAASSTTSSSLTSSSTTSSSSTSSSTTSSAAAAVAPATSSSADPCQSMFASATCRTSSQDPSQVDSSGVANARGWLCGNYPQFCTAVSSGGQYSSCNSVQQLSYAMTQYYNNFGPQQGASACNFGGMGNIVAQPAATSSSTSRASTTSSSSTTSSTTSAAQATTAAAVQTPTSSTTAAKPSTSSTSAVQTPTSTFSAAAPCARAGYCSPTMCACNGACYDQSQYCCVNNQLTQIQFCPK